MGLFGKYFDLFSKNFSQNFTILVKKQLILQDFGIIKKKDSPKTEKNGSVALVKQVFGFFPHRVMVKIFK